VAEEAYGATDVDVEVAMKNPAATESDDRSGGAAVKSTVTEVTVRSILSQALN
jgi:hypothetical protein